MPDGCRSGHFGHKSLWPRAWAPESLDHGCFGPRYKRWLQSGADHLRAYVAQCRRDGWGPARVSRTGFLERPEAVEDVQRDAGHERVGGGEAIGPLGRAGVEHLALAAPEAR